VICLSAAAFAAPVRAQTEAQLWTLLDTQSQARGRFLQELYSEDDELLERSSGDYAVLRPDYFRWEIDYPDRQLIVISGHELWHYDIDLAAATRRDTRDNREFTPLELLAGNSEELRERFSVEPMDAGRYRLVPLFAQAGFASVDMTWENGEIVAMAVRDRSGQLISLTLTPEPDAPALSPEDFHFVPPDGVDVYDSAQ
jgi:chaperone LolA